MQKTLTLVYMSRKIAMNIGVQELHGYAHCMTEYRKYAVTGSDWWYRLLLQKSLCHGMVTITLSEIT